MVYSGMAGCRFVGPEGKGGVGRGHIFGVFWQSGLWVFELGGQGAI